MTDRTKEAQKVTWIGFFFNLFLSVAKLIAGLIGNSAAMVADAIHSIQILQLTLYIAFVRISDKEGDEDHKYGHGNSKHSQLC
jgi:divalent metal cation (Fe/Co/Zn/Cd) transporter